MHKIIIILILLIGLNTYGQSAKATCRVSATIVRVDCDGNIIDEDDDDDDNDNQRSVEVKEPLVAEVGMTYQELIDKFVAPEQIITMPNGKKKLIYSDTTIYVKDGLVDIILKK